MTKLLECRSCGSRELAVFLDLGVQPNANSLLEDEDLDRAEPKFPLQLARCQGCGLVQVTETIPPEVLFGSNYPYFSSFSTELLRHSREHALALIKEYRLDRNSLVVEVASNDGYLLRNFVEAGVPALGIDPAAGPVAAARERGVPTIQSFFGTSLARKLADEGKLADVIIANNVAAHVDAINDFIGGFAVLLKPGGIAKLEFAYLRDLIERCEFDTVYHEHLFYHSVAALEPLFERHGLHLNDAERLSIHGGSLRISVSRSSGRTPRLRALRASEAALGMDSLEHYQTFSRRAGQLRDRLTSLILEKRREGARIAAYGAAAKGATLLNFLNLERGTLDYVVDRNPHKVGKYMPGSRLPIRPVADLLTDRPDYVVLLAWNFASEIIEQNRDFSQRGGRFILPVPNPVIV